MTEKEQIEKWREEFIDLSKSKKTYQNCVWFTQKKRFQNSQTESMWQGFLMAKRKINPIAIPPVWIDEFGHQHVSLQSLTIALNISGYPYSLPGE